MLIASNHKQHLHIYVILILTILILSDFIALKYFNFVATPLTNYFALIISCVICIGILLYFFRLKQHGLWFPPYHWRNFRKHLKFYSLFIFPSVMISALWINLTTYPPIFIRSWQAKLTVFQLLLRLWNSKVFDIISPIPLIQNINIYRLWSYLLLSFYFIKINPLNYSLSLQQVL